MSDSAREVDAREVDAREAGDPGARGPRELGAQGARGARELGALGAQGARELGDSPTLWELIDRRARLTPDRPVLIQAEADPADDRTLTFGALRDRAERVAAGLYERGVRPGTVVAWQLPTRIETVLLSAALARIGATQSPIIPFYRDKEVGFALRASRAEFFATPGVWRGFDHTELARRLGARGVFEAYEDGDLPD
ncbi:AMP-binding protein, partial [Streptomyces boluensis]